MDAKDLRTESAVTERNNDGSKYSQGNGIALHCDRNKSYQDIGSNSLGKVDVQNARPCAVIGPDRVVPPPAASEAYHIKKSPAEPWLCMDGTYRRPPEYPHKLTNYQNPPRNISPRQTFQENMQRIMVPPTYSSIKVNEDTNYAQVSERSNGLTKNIKLNMPPEAKFSDVPYAVNPTNNEHKNVRNPEMCLPSANPTLTRTAPHGWPPGSVNLRSTRMYGAPELYQYQEYPSCAGPRPVVPRPHRTVPEEQGYVYGDPYYQEGNLRFKPYPTSKERYPQQRYEHIGNYSNPFHPLPGFQPHKYELQKPMPPHPYPPYPPIKYLDSRVGDPVLEGYQRNPQGLGPNYNIQYRNQVIHPNYGPVVGNSPQNKMHSYPPDAHLKSIPPNKLPYDSNAKAYIEYEISRPKIYPPSESYFVNEMTRMPMKSQVIMPNYSNLNMHNIPPNPYYKKDTQNLKNYENMAHFRTMDPNLNIHNPMSRHAPVFSPNTLAISPTDSNTSNDTTQTLGTSQEDCGYVSQSSTASVRSIDSGINRMPNEYLRKYYENRYGPIVRTSPMMSKSQSNTNNNSSKDKKQIDVRQFLQMWNEGDEEQEDNGSKEITAQTSSSDKNNFGKTNSHDAMNSQQSQEQLYVLGLVNVPSEELAKYEHIQKVSKLPENIKGYNSIELLNQFEEVIESSHMKNYKSPTPKESMYHMPMKGGQVKQVTAVIPPRPVSPLDVEAKISQSVIHKDVGCNFEIKPCSPKMLNVEVAAPVQNILVERSIEKVVNPVMLRSPMSNGINENIDCNMMKRTDHLMNMNENLRIPSCKMIKTQFSNSNSIDPIKTSYSIHDLESNSGLCLASLPRLDNDIELNFPEVNQQFINANKGDNTVLASSIRDLPTLEVLDQSPKQIKDKSNNTNSSRPEYDVVKSPYNVVKSPYDIAKSPYDVVKSPYDIAKSPFDVRKSPYDIAKSTYDVVKSPYNVVKSPCDVVKSPYMVDRSPHMVDKSPHMLDRSPHMLDKSPQLGDSEKGCSKLSKYRKTKTFETKETHIQHNINAFRTDSVIIKNPENVKNHEENSNFSNGLNKVIMEIQQAPINLTSQGNLSNNLENQPHTTYVQDREKEKHLPVEIAIDFSLNKTGIFNSTEYMETKLESQINTSTLMKEPTLNTINKNNSSDSIHLLPVFTDENDFFCNVDNKGIGSSLDSIKDSQDESKPIAANNKINYEVDTEIPACNKSYQNIEIETKKIVSYGAEDMILDVSSARSASKTEIRGNELVGNFNNKSTEKKICKRTTDELTKEANCSLTEMSSKASESLEKYEMDTAENNTHNFVDTFSSNIPVYTATKKDFVALEINRSSEISDPMVTEQTLQHDKKNLLTTEEICCNDSESVNFNTTLEPKHTFLKDYVIDHQNDNTENSTTQSSEELLDPEKDMKDFEDTYCEDTQKTRSNFKDSYCEDRQSSPENFEETDCKDTLSSPENTNLCDIDQSAEDLEHGLEESFRRNLWYGSKELYSPWIQKLITFSEGNCINAIMKTEMDSHSDIFVDTTETPTTESNNDHEESDLGITKSVSLEGNNDDHDKSDFEIKIPIEEITTEKNSGDSNDSDLEIKSLPQQEVTTEYNDQDNFEMRKSGSIEEVTTKINDDHNGSDFEIINSASQQEVSTIKNNDHYGSDIRYRKSTPTGEVTTEKNNDRNSSDLKIRKSVPQQEAVTEHNDNDDSDFEIGKSVTQLEVATENNDHDDSDFKIRKSVSQQEVAIQNNDHDDYDFEISKLVSLQEVATENNDNDVYDFAIKKPVSEQEEATENNDLDDSDFETDKSEPKEKNDHDDGNFETRISVPKQEIATESNSDFEMSKSEQVEEVISEHNGSNFEKRKSTPQQEVTTETHDHDDFELRKSIPPEEVSHKNLGEDVNRGHNSYDTVEEKKSQIFGNNLDETANPEDHVEREDISKDEEINHEENEYTVDQVDNITAASSLSANCKFNESNIIDPTLESEPNNNGNTDIKAEAQLNSYFEGQCVPDTSNLNDVSNESFQEVAEHCGEQPVDKEAEIESSDHFEHVPFSHNGLQANDASYKKSHRLKRSLSDSALNKYNDDEPIKQDDEESVQFIWPFKRRKMNTVENDFLTQNLCSIINHNRRNSVSSFYNEDNVSFCILIDNSCIITEEENEEPETQNCYTELSEECLAEIQSSYTKPDENIETVAEVAVSPQQEKCDNSDSFMLDEDKTLEESWDEDVGCVETVISDDIAEDIEISGPSSPKEVALSDNDESGIFSCSEHTDKVKFIYGEKMCNDDALFVETLYKTPQMDVNKTLYNRETRVSDDYGRYYDNDSLEKMLSESNEPPVSPYVPQYLDEMFPSGKAHSKETPENKENMDTESYPALQSKGNALDIVVDINVDDNDRENMHSIDFFAKTRDDTTRSCESSVDNVFTYNQKDEDAIYTSSSPEVSSTTSEEKNSGILLKITNYQGSRISQINDISRVNKRSRCKFTEEKEYSRTHANYSSNRPLLTKGAQKYIPPLRESIRDLKVKLSLPQHSLMKLKQLKISKDEPKVNKQNATMPRIPKKPKPKFEDVLKSIDEIQFKKHKEKTKKTKKAIPKVVIKKNMNGSHYASTSNKDDFNPDLTGRKWQPWVFIEKNHFIDKMATRKKTKAVYSHRKKTYVLAEKFQKYKSANSTKFVISPPISDSPSSGLKYTIRLKHNY